MEIWTTSSEGISTYWGGTTVTLQAGENTVSVTAVRLPWRNTSELIQRKPPVSLCFIFYDLANNIYDFTFDSSFFEEIGFPAKAERLVVYVPTGNFEVVSGGPDNGTSYTDSQQIPLYDDGLHYDGQANDGIWNMRLNYVSGTGSPPEGVILFSVRDPLGGNFYSYEFCGKYPVVYTSNKLSTPASAIAGADETWTAGEDITVAHSLTGGSYTVFVLFESSSNPVDFETLSSSEDVFRQLVFRASFVIPFSEVSNPSNPVIYTATDVSLWVSPVEGYDPRAYGFDQMRFVIVDETNGQWQVSNPIRFSF